MPTPPTNPQAEPKVRKTYTKEFKIQPVVLAKRPGMGYRQATTDHGLNESMLRAWAKSPETEGPEAFRGHRVRYRKRTRTMLIRSRQTCWSRTFGSAARTSTR